MKISIIIAAYNVEHYIARCISSVRNQTYRNIEIIVINDCSTDETKNICSIMSQNDNRIILINKEKNEGLSEARNTGINQATGEYITFVDGDDFIEVDTIENCVKAIEKSKADEIVFGSSFDRRNGQICMMKMTHSLDYYQGADMEKYLNESLGSLPHEKNDRNIGITPWGRVYKKSILECNKLRFISERTYIYEDLMFFLLSTPYVKSVLILDKPLYHYCENEGSLTQKLDLSRFYRVKHMYEHIKKIYLSMIFKNEETKLRFDRLMLSYIRLSVLQIGRSTKNIGMIREICSDKFTREVVENYPVKKLPVTQKIFASLLKYRCALLLYVICKVYK